MKKIGKFLIGLFIIIGIFALIIMGIRWVNGRRYAKYQLPEDAPEYLSNGADMSLYPTVAEGVTVTPVRDGTVQGFHIKPNKQSHEGVIITYGGSEGSPNFDLAVSLAREGYESLALYFYGQENQEKSLENIPIDQFQETLDWLAMNVEDAKIITIYGASKGAEYAANVASYYNEVDHVILMAPASHNFQGLGSNMGASWTYKGEELPYLSFMEGEMTAYIPRVFLPMLINTPITFNASYEPLLTRASNLDAARIPVERSKADFLIFAGSDDQMWPSKRMGEIIKEAIPDKVNLIVYEGAGHIFAGPSIFSDGHMVLNIGGSLEVNFAANEASQALMMEQLAKWH